MKLIVKLRTGDGFDVWNMNSKCAAAARPIAKKLGLSLEEFLTRFSTATLPGRLTNEPSLDRENAPPAGFQVTECADKTLWKRITRAAALEEISVDLFIWRSIASTVECIEEGLLTDPRNGTPIGDESDLWEFRTRTIKGERIGFC